ncbi:MAG: hypothetical protein HQ507_13550 [Candidatus Marinimicrobia bacterium]|nr:hypothetical protein [Candidatus Neomarinimicrobiota bacterium]
MKIEIRSNLLTLIAIIIMVPTLLNAQYKSEVPNIPGLNTRNSNVSASFFGIDLSKVSFQHSYSMQVNSFGNDAVAMGLLKTSFNYMINPQVSVQGSVGLMHSPFSTFSPVGEQSAMVDGLNSNNIIYSGEISYRPKENMLFQIGFSRMPTHQFNQYYSPYSFRQLGY